MTRDTAEPQRAGQTEGTQSSLQDLLGAEAQVLDPAVVAHLVDLGIHDEFIGHARNRRIRYAPYIALFHEHAG